MSRSTDTSPISFQASLGWLHRSTSREDPSSPDAGTADRYQATFELYRVGRSNHILGTGVYAEYLVHEQQNDAAASIRPRTNDTALHEALRTARTSSQVLGTFIEDTWTPLRSISLEVMGGVRYDLQRVLAATGGGAPLFTGSQVSPRLGVSYTLHRVPITRFYTQVGMAMSQVPLRLVELHQFDRNASSAPLIAPSARDVVTGMAVDTKFDSGLSLEYLHRKLRAPIDSVWSTTSPKERTYDAVTWVFGRNNEDAQAGLKLLLSYTWSRLTEQGQGRVRRAPIPDSVGLGNSAPVDRPHTVKAFVSWARLFGPKLITRVGLSYLGESGAWMLDAPRRLDWHNSLDASVSLSILEWRDQERFTGGVDVFNLLNFQAVTRTDALGAPAEYQPPRQVRLQARYTF